MDLRARVGIEIVSRLEKVPPKVCLARSRQETNEMERLRTLGRGSTSEDTGLAELLLDSDDAILCSH
jgi:hypothetical protein